VDSFLSIVSKRDTRRYADREVPEGVRSRILEAGRLAGSAMNRQPWRFVLVESADAKKRVAETVYVPGTVEGAPFVVAIVGPGSLDVGRCMQNMMLAAWNDGVVSCPNGMPDPGPTAEALGLEGEEHPAIVLTFGYPVTGHTAEKRSADEWIASAERTPLDELVSRV
jgi:nitroreductase